MITSLIKQYILPKEVDFISSLQEHSSIVHKIVKDLYQCFIDANESSCNAILDDEHMAEVVREKNMNELLNTFLTPIDRESIYRVISQLDWIAVSVRHFVLEARAYNMATLHSGYADILKDIKEQSHMLNLGFINLKNSKPAVVAKNAQDVRDGYEKVVEIYIDFF